VSAADFLARSGSDIVEAATHRIERVQRYEAAGVATVRQRVEALFGRLVESIGEQDIRSVVAYAEQLAEARFNAGYNLAEVQTAFNAVEEATWTWAMRELQPAEYADVLGVVTTVLGAGKDALARRYVSLATQAHAPSVDLPSLFAGTEGV
jgi:hypothetical protein